MIYEFHFCSEHCKFHVDTKKSQKKPQKDFRFLHNSL